MYYKIERTYLTNVEGESEQRSDPTPHFVSAPDAPAAASAFIRSENARLLGGVSAFVGDKATATGWVDGRLYTIFVQRGAEAIHAREAERDLRRP